MSKLQIHAKILSTLQCSGRHKEINAYISLHKSAFLKCKTGNCDL